MRYSNMITEVEWLFIYVGLCLRYLGVLRFCELVYEGFPGWGY